MCKSLGYEQLDYPMFSALFVSMGNAVLRRLNRNDCLSS